MARGEAEAREQAAKALREEVQRRNEWYGLDNWSFGEVVDFVADKLRQARNEPPLGRCTDVGWE